MRYDPRYEAARATSQSDRGWDFRPVERDTVPLKAFIAVAVAVAALAGLVVVVW